MEEVLDGEYQHYAGHPGSFVREHFFGKYEELAEMVADMSDEDLWRLKRGGHDPQKVYAAYHAAVDHQGQPSVILAKTVKGYGMGESGEGQNITHQQKKMGEESLRTATARVPDAATRGRFMSLQATAQHLGAVMGSLLGMALLTDQADGRLAGMPTLALCSIGMCAAVPVLLWRVERR
jgi:pyruvate dehydrogenase complex dehydrogenase (E1) component